MPKYVWHNLNSERVLDLLKSGKGGLSSKEAIRRARDCGANKFPRAKAPAAFKIFFAQFKSPLVYILAGAAIISFLLKDGLDGAIITAAVLLNTIVGFIEEYRADRGLRALQKIISYHVKVLRNGAEKEIDASELVPGDIVFLEMGDKIPADGRLIEAHNFEVSEASLTGESMPIRKNIRSAPVNASLADRASMVYAGTVAMRGRAMAVVTETGKRTEIGKIASMLKEIPEGQTPLQNEISKLGKMITYIVSGICVVIFILGIIERRGALEVFNTAVAVAVAAIPESLIISVTIVLIIGMKKILKEKALVRKIVAAETLGNVSVICTDKTGTLTEGEMRVAGITWGEEFVNLNHIVSRSASEKARKKYFDILRAGLLCNDAVIEETESGDQKVLGDAVEKALLIAGQELGLNKKGLEESFPRIDEAPFDSASKYMATLHNGGPKENLLFVKGAAELVLSLSKRIKINGKSKVLTVSERKNLENILEDLARKGYRVLGFAFREFDKKINKFQNGNGLVKDLSFLGFVCFDDPLRAGVKETIDIAKRAGIRTVMITGDHPLTAKRIALKLGLPSSAKNILTGKDLEEITDEDLREAVKRASVFARVEPYHKVRIVDAFQANGASVAMTGDGVNDAPALKSADIGIALGFGTEVAKDASDIVLLDNNFKTIVSTVEKGRVIYDNIKKVVLYLLKDGFTEIILIFASMLAGLPLPLLPAQILWVNLIEDTLPTIALSMDPGDKGLMYERPRQKKSSILDSEMKVIIFIIGIFTDILLFGMFLYFWTITKDIDYVRTIIFAGLGINSLLVVWPCRSMRYSVLQKNPFENKFLIGAVGIGFLMFFLALYTPFFQNVLRTVPLGLFEWGVILSLGVVNVLLIEIVKYGYIVRNRNNLKLKGV
jgi:Ca2+-transporting ATPase